MKILIIDYFNFLYHRYYHLEEKIIINNLQDLTKFAYNQNKKIYIFFDGLFWSYLNVDSKHIILYFSPQGMNADQYILKTCSHLQGKTNFIITQDNELIKAFQKTSSFSVLLPRELWKLLDSYLAQQNYYHNKKNISPLKKITPEKNTALENLYYSFFSED